MFGKKTPTPTSDSKPAKPSDMPRLDVSVRRDVQLGQTGKDIITSFQGVVVALCHEIDGSLLVGLQSRELDGGKPADAIEFDIERLEISGEAAILPERNPERPTITLGARYRDRITGFEGYAIRVIDFLGGCSHIYLSREVDKDGKLCDAARFPVERAELIDKGKSEEVKPVRSGGPGDSARGTITRRSNI